MCINLSSPGTNVLGEVMRYPQRFCCCCRYRCSSSSCRHRHRDHIFSHSRPILSMKKKVRRFLSTTHINENHVTQECRYPYPPLPAQSLYVILPLWSIFMNENGVRYFDVNHALISHTYAISSDIALPVFLRIVTICSKIHSSSGNVTYVKFWTDQSACSLARNTPSALAT